MFPSLSSVRALRRIPIRLHFIGTRGIIVPAGSFTNIQSKFLRISRIDGKFLSTFPESAVGLNGMKFNTSPFVDYVSNNKFVASIHDAIIELHDFTGLPWWVTIVSTAILTRTFILPMSIHQRYVLAKLENVEQELQSFEKSVNAQICHEAVIKNWNAGEMRRAHAKMIKKKRLDIIIRDNCHPLKLFVLAALHVPVWIGASAAIKSIVSNDPVANTEMMVGGFWWITNLTTPDTTYIFPIFLSFCNLTIIQINQISRYKSTSGWNKFIVNVARVLTILMIYIAASIPSCLLLYWVVSSAYGVCQNLLLLSRDIQSFCGIPHSKMLKTNPYGIILKKMTGFIRFLK